jgi:thiamine pyrophosphate-dependent acetolactate synthase large subunit-like protein
MGIEASRAHTAEAFEDQFAAAMAARGPRLIEAVI